MERSWGPLLGLLNDYFKGAGDGLGGADRFAQGAPVAVLALNNVEHLVNEYQGITGAHGNTQPAAVALLPVNFGHCCQWRFLLCF